MSRPLFIIFIKLKFSDLLPVENNRAPKKNNRAPEKVPVRKLLGIEPKKN